MNADEVVRGLRESCTGNKFAPPMVTNRELTEAADLIESLQAQLDEYDKEAKRQTNTIAEQHVLILELQGEIRRLQSAIINECDSCACEIANERDRLVREIERLKNELDITDAQRAIGGRA